MPRPFTIAHTADFFDETGASRFRDLGLDLIDKQSGIAVTRLAEHRHVLGADQLEGVNAVVVLSSWVTAETVSRAANLLAVGRFGVGYETVDLAACAGADVLVFIAAGAVDRSVAEATVGWMIALAHHVRIKDGLLRAGRWDERARHMGRELRDRTLGVVGLGGIGRATIDLLRGFGMKPPLAFDPFVPPAAAEQAGVRLVALHEVLREADFVSIHCPLNDRTRGLIGATELALMKPDAYLINTARGGIVDEPALCDALREGRLAGAAIDCFENEPVTTPHPLAELDNVLLAPHSIAWTDEIFRDIGRTVCRGMIDLSQGRRPNGVVNPEVLEKASFREKWARLTS